MERPQTRRGSSQGRLRQRDRPESATETDYIINRSPTSPLPSAPMVNLLIVFEFDNISNWN